MNIFVLDLTLLCQKTYYACVFSWMYKKIYITDNKAYDFTLYLLLPPFFNFFHSIINANYFVINILFVNIRLSSQEHFFKQ